MPSHPVAQSLLREFAGDGSAPAGGGTVRQLFGQVSPTTAQHVAEEFPQQALLVL